MMMEALEQRRSRTGSGQSEGSADAQPPARSRKRSREEVSADGYDSEVLAAPPAEPGEPPGKDDAPESARRGVRASFYRPSTRMSHGLSQTNVWSSFYMTKERPWGLQRTKRCAFLMQIRSSCSRMVRSLFKDIFVGPRKSRNSQKSSGLWTRTLPRASQIPLRRYQWLWTM